MEEEDIVRKDKKEDELSKQGASVSICNIFDLSIALVTLGVPLYDNPPYTFRKDSHGLTINFLFRAASRNAGHGSYKTHDLIGLWQKTEMGRATMVDTHPLAVCMKTRDGRRRVKELEATSPRPLSEVRTEIRNAIRVKSPKLAAVLYGAGVIFHVEHPVAMDAGRPVFIMSEWEAKGRWKTRDLIKEWDSYEKFAEANPVHPFSVAAMYVHNFVASLQHFSELDKPMVAFKMNGGGTYFCREGSRKHKIAQQQGMEIA